MQRTRTNFQRASLSLGATILALSLTAGCGGDDNAGATAKPLPKKEFIVEADRLCAEAGEKYDTVIAGLPPFGQITAPDVPPTVMAEVGKAAVPLAEVEREIEGQLRALTPPADLGQRWDRALDTLGTRANFIEEIGEAAAAGDRAAYLEGFQRFSQAGTIGSRELRGYGFEVCGVN